MKKIITLLSALLLCVTLQAAYLTNVPRTLIQPNGDTLHCFASGDEYYVRLHDAQGYTIVQNPQTGYFVYAVRENGCIKPSSWIAGQCNPAAKGLVPNLRISREEYLKLRRDGGARQAIGVPRREHQPRAYEQPGRLHPVCG